MSGRRAAIALLALPLAARPAARGREAEALELLERTETRLLTRSTAPVQAGQPVEWGPVAAIGEAREAIRRRDRATAVGRIAAAIQEIEARQAALPRR
jgi:hypothetical protein